MYLTDHVAELRFVNRLIYAIKRIYTHHGSMNLPHISFTDFSGAHAAWHSAAGGAAGMLLCKCNISMVHGSALFESTTFNRRVVGSTPALAATLVPWASPLPAVACALRRETPIQYPCCSRERL